MRNQNTSKHTQNRQTNKQTNKTNNKINKTEQHLSNKGDPAYKKMQQNAHWSICMPTNHATHFWNSQTFCSASFNNKSVSCWTSFSSIRADSWSGGGKQNGPLSYRPFANVEIRRRDSGKKTELRISIAILNCKSTVQIPRSATWCLKHLDVLWLSS